MLKKPAVIIAETEIHSTLARAHLLCSEKP